MERAEVDSQKYKTEFEEERVKKERLEKRLGEVTENLREVEKEEESHCEEINLLKDFVYNVDGAASYKKLGAKNQSEQKISKLLFDLILQLKEKILGSKDKECLCDSIAFEVKSLYIELERKIELQSQILEVVTSLYQKLEVIYLRSPNNLYSLHPLIMTKNSKILIKDSHKYSLLIPCLHASNLLNIMLFYYIP